MTGLILFGYNFFFFKLLLDATMLITCFGGLFCRSSTLEDGLSPEKTMLNVCPYTTHWWVRFELVPLAPKLVV